MMMLVIMGDREAKGKRWLSELAFLAITVGPYVLLGWLLWPWR